MYAGDLLKSFDLIVVGAGPAGLFCAIVAALAGLNVCILEKNRAAGRKLLLTGSGRCNLTHDGDRSEFLSHYGAKGRFVKGPLFSFTNADLRSFFQTNGVRLAADVEGRVFPSSQKSGDVLKALLDECGRRKVAVLYNHPASRVTKKTDGFEIETAGPVYFVRNVVLATGGISYPQTGSAGDGFRLAEGLGHSIVEPSPALTPLNIRDFAFAACAGISFDSRSVRLLREKKEIGRVSGDVLITHQGLSGPAILNLSRQVRPNDSIRFPLAPDKVDSKEVESSLVREAADNGRMLVRKHLARYRVPERILLRVFELHNIPRDLTLSDLDKKSRANIASDLTGMQFTVKSVAGYSEAMVTAGGVSLPEVNHATMESRIVPGLYFAGEVLDVDGDTGGYNLQFAFSSGFLAGTSIARKNTL